MDRPELSTTRQFVATAPRGLSDLLAAELVALGAQNVRDRASGVLFEGELAVGYKACLWSRTASRVLLNVGGFEFADASGLYSAARRIDWSAHLAPGSTLACELTGRHQAIINTHFGALKVKDAIVDQARERGDERPDIALERPDLRVHAHVTRDSVSFGIDLAGESLSRRGYRQAAGEAPLRENVAAGMLLRAGWQSLAAQGAEFLDPMCGSGTLVIEAALIAGNIAPGLRRDYYGFFGWRGHDMSLWGSLLDAARAASDASPSRSVIRGSDHDPRLLGVARANAQRAGVDGFVSFATCEADTTAAQTTGAGLLAMNPPYGMRLDVESAREAHRAIGRALRERFGAWHAVVLTGDPKLGLEIGVKANRSHTLWNGALECRLLRFKPSTEQSPAQALPKRARGGIRMDDAEASARPGARMFANRLGKNLDRLSKRARREGTTCYRLYDADMPEYALAIDLYHCIDDGRPRLFVQEYAAPAEIEPQAVRRRRDEALSVLPEVTGISLDDIHLRTRQRQRGSSQYEKLDSKRQMHVIDDRGAKLQVNFTDYLDTGVFLDHRSTRVALGAAASGKRFLNLFAYTGSATVHALLGGATSTLSIDLSHTYNDWTLANLELNGLRGERNVVLRADCREWLTSQPREPAFDLIFLDPPTFSNSKRMEGVLDLQRDHHELIEACMGLLSRDGLLVFSTNAQRFKLESQLLERFAVRDITRSSIPFDFERNPRIHTCFELRHA
ncbi:MAG: bifunctional 23S rRNA (guanine(2069)-N(7))-methyltransferase RlmK/23S rRNA (guanine(2445)-N(2))-methyltransferase RlmL [Steroidobacteraceae bacterium]